MKGVASIEYTNNLLMVKEKYYLEDFVELRYYCKGTIPVGDWWRLRGEQSCPGQFLCACNENKGLNGSLKCVL